MLNKSLPLLFQEFIKGAKGRDIRVIVCQGKVIGSMMRIANEGYKSNFHKGGSVKSIEISQELKDMAILATKAVKLEIAGIDFLMDSNGYYICEVNASPGFEGFELATGINVAKELLVTIISNLSKKDQ